MTMVVIQEPPEAPRKAPLVEKPREPSQVVAADPAPVADPPSWDEQVNRGDHVAFAFWMVCVIILALMSLVDLLLGFFR
jgi:hypothetical protein